MKLTVICMKSTILNGKEASHDLLQPKKLPQRWIGGPGLERRVVLQKKLA